MYTLTFVFDSGWQWMLVIPLAFVLSRFTAVPILPMFAAVAVAESVKCLLGWYFVKRGDWVRDLVNKECRAENEAWMAGSEE